ncbi:hypothetical protein JB92DRAFT_2831233 [Gautieria morchelliformis]|nr:hypothetical protein JB92DRAFT_2831233 [Gautieria morchelliformis]
MRSTLLAGFSRVDLQHPSLPYQRTATPAFTAATSSPPSPLRPVGRITSGRHSCAPSQPILPEALVRVGVVLLLIRLNDRRHGATKLHDRERENDTPAHRAQDNPPVCRRVGNSIRLCANHFREEVLNAEFLVAMVACVTPHKTTPRIPRSRGVDAVHMRSMVVYPTSQQAPEAGPSTESKLSLHERCSDEYGTVGALPAVDGRRVTEYGCAGQGRGAGEGPAVKSGYGSTTCSAHSARFVPTNRHEFTPFLTSMGGWERYRHRLAVDGRRWSINVVVLWAAAAPSGKGGLMARVVDWKTNED